MTGCSDTGKPAETKNNAQNQATGQVGNKSDTTQTTNKNVKEFSMTSFTDIINGKYFPQYSLKEITVKKWDLVRIKITVTKGMHNFNIDEFNIHSETPTNKETTVEFTADKVGKFIYYCSKPGHRANGHRGTLIVTE